MNKKEIVIVPVYNEAPTLKRVLDKIKAKGRGVILAVDDGSDDGSGAILDACPNVTVVRHQENRGYGASLISGFAYAVEQGFEQAVTIDCDEQHEPALIPQMFDRLLVSGADVLSGSRYLEEQIDNDTPPADRRRVNLTITALINQITGYGLTDTFCGFKAYQVAALAKLKLDEPGYAMPLQLWVQAKHFGFCVEEIAAPRIYKNLNRSFGALLDDSDRRLAYYTDIINKELARWSISSSSELTRTI